MRNTDLSAAASRSLSAGESLELIMDTCSPQQRRTLELIRAACDRIAAVDGRISQANVAREIEKAHGRNIYQTIRNVGAYRTYIKQREIEASLSAASSKNRTGTSAKITDPIAATQIEILEVQLENARKQIQRAKRGIEQLQPISAAEMKKVLAAIEVQHDSEDLSSIEAGCVCASERGVRKAASGRVSFQIPAST